MKSSKEAQEVFTQNLAPLLFPVSTTTRTRKDIPSQTVIGATIVTLFKGNEVNNIN